MRANGKPLEKESIKIYPFSIYLENKEKILNQSTDAGGFQTLSGSYRKKESRIEIWREQKPSNFDERINELFKTSGSNIQARSLRICFNTSDSFMFNSCINRSTNLWRGS